MSARLAIREYEMIRHGRCASAPGADIGSWDSLATGIGESEEQALVCALGYLHDVGWEGSVDLEVNQGVSPGDPWYLSLRVRA